MKRTTTRLVGPQLTAFLRRVLGAEMQGASPDEAADRLAGLLASARVKRSALATLRRRERLRNGHDAQTDATTGQDAAPSEPTAAASSAPPAAETRDFDPYEVSLVPMFQRDGADAVATALSAITEPDHLRKMARAQQLALPSTIRRGDVPAETIRGAILTAIEKRIADRKAAAS